MKYISIFTTLFLFSLLFPSCSEGDKSVDNIGYAPSDINNHSFQFYNNTKWIFSINCHNDMLSVDLQEGRVLYGDPVFDYKRVGPDEAECLLSISFEYLLNQNSVYNSYCGTVVLNFLSPQGGTYSVYDLQTGELGSSGKFTIDQKEEISNDTPTPNEPTLDEPVPNNPELSENAIHSQINKIYSNAVVINFTYNKSEVKKTSQIGYCWGTQPNPTVERHDSKPMSLDLNGNGKGEGSIQYELTSKPGTDYYIRTYALIDKKFIYFNEQKIQSVGKDIQLKTFYNLDSDKIAIDYAIQKEGTFELRFFANLTRSDNSVANDNLGYVTSGKGQKFVPNYSCFYYYAYLTEIDTGINYYSDTIYK